MPSPFPGMDPYLESPDIWSDLHHSLACSISAILNEKLPVSYYARTNSRNEVGDERDFVEAALLNEPLRHHFVEIRDPTKAHKLITLIEIVSPSNKRRGADREAYQQKQREVLESDANLIEIDLLRSGQRLLRNQSLLDLILRTKSRSTCNTPSTAPTTPARIVAERSITPSRRVHRCARKTRLG